jgi:hypothetical protein
VNPALRVAAITIGRPRWRQQGFEPQPFDLGGSAIGLCATSLALPNGASVSTARSPTAERMATRATKREIG